MERYCEDCQFCEIDNFQRLIDRDETYYDSLVKDLKCKVTEEKLAWGIRRHYKTKVPENCIYYDVLFDSSYEPYLFGNK